MRVPMLASSCSLGVSSMGARGRLLHEGEMARNFTVVVYQEHITEEDLDIILDDMGVKCARSPLHAQDRYDKSSVRKWEKRHTNPTEEELKRKPVEGELKKPHWHVSFQLKGRKKLENILKMLDAELGVTSVWKDNDPEHAIRYLCHLDSPKKTQYPIQEVVSFGGMDVSALEKLSKVDKVNVVATVCEHIRDERCTNFYDLTNWVIEQRDIDMFDSIVSKTAFYQNYMVGLRTKMNESMYYKGLPREMRGI